MNDDVLQSEMHRYRPPQFCTSRVTQHGARYAKDEGTLASYVCIADEPRDVPAYDIWWARKRGRWDATESSFCQHITPPLLTTPLASFFLRWHLREGEHMADSFHAWIQRRWGWRERERHTRTRRLGGSRVLVQTLRGLAWCAGRAGRAENVHNMMWRWKSLVSNWGKLGVQQSWGHAPMPSIAASLSHVS